MECLFLDFKITDGLQIIPSIITGNNFNSIAIITYRTVNCNTMEQAIDGSGCFDRFGIKPFPMMVLGNMRYEVLQLIAIDSFFCVCISIYISVGEKQKSYLSFASPLFIWKIILTTNRIHWRMYRIRI